MKHLAISLLALISAFDLSAAEKKVTIKGASEIVSTGVADVYYVQSNKNLVTITGTQEQIERVSVTNANNVLNISTIPNEDRKFSYRGLRVKVESPDVYKFTTKGSGDIEVTGNFRNIDTPVVVTSYGSGDIEMRAVYCMDFTAHSSGSGDIEITKITCGKVEMSSNGSGDIDVDLIDARETTLSTHGSGDIEVERLQSVEVTASTAGSGDIELPSLDVTTVSATSKGSGDITLGGNAVNVITSKKGAGSIFTSRLRTSK